MIPVVHTNSKIVKSGSPRCQHSYTRANISRTFRKATCLRCGRQTVTQITVSMPPKTV